jgi:hypothetical protein
MSRDEWAESPPGEGAPPGTIPGATTTDSRQALTKTDRHRDPIARRSGFGVYRPRRREFIRRHWTVACLDRLCINCTCGRSIALEAEGEADRDDSDLTA